ncbi:uncharacterized protein RSE6_11539 [Rhynchosporium secalis]|uniref:G-protein coupled receptors family 2 profile 2 domain-containing protein n=1 Tax=Rhynchosporium secalis TaxID=38038 RepID=A0A1E1MN65_RHYSE|nr:uncharacterized protein RSE6_11539 [Rhynchosporium secalis]
MLLAKDLTELQLWNISAIERIASAFSFISVVFIITSFLMLPEFQKPITRLIFYASAGNFFMCVATMISRAPIHSTEIIHPNLCRTQAFLIQMFMPADALWALAMGVNLFSAFYFQVTELQRYRLEMCYIAFCYGAPCIVASVLLLVATEERGPIYGNATLWCWITSDWDDYRMYLFYGPIWIICILIILILIRLCYTMVMNRLNLSAQTHWTDPTVAQNTGGGTGTKTKRFSSRSKPASPIPLQDMSSRGNTTQDQTPGFFTQALQKHISGCGSGDLPDLPAHLPGTYPAEPKQKYRIATIFGAAYINAKRLFFRQPPRASQHRNTASADAALKLIATVALFFFFIMLITWIPSSANRLYSVVYPGHVSLPLLYLAAGVLPLQGFWNCVIYCYITRKACKDLFMNLRQHRRWSADSLRSAFAEQPGNHRTTSGGIITSIPSRTPSRTRTPSRPISHPAGFHASGSGARYNARPFEDEDGSVTSFEWNNTEASCPNWSRRPNQGSRHMLDLDNV